MNRLFLIVGVGIAIVALMFLNQGIKKASPTDEDLQKQAQQEAQKAAPPASAPKQVAPPIPAAPSAILPSEETVGNPITARHHILVGWVYDESNQAKPQTLMVPLQAVRDFVQQSRGMASSEIVDIDVPVGDRSPAGQVVTDLGITVDGKPLVTGNLSDKPLRAQQITQILAAAAK